MGNTSIVPPKQQLDPTGRQDRAFSYAIQDGLSTGIPRDREKAVSAKDSGAFNSQAIDMLTYTY